MGNTRLLIGRNGVFLDGEINKDTLEIKEGLVIPHSLISHFGAENVSLYVPENFDEKEASKGFYAKAFEAAKMVGADYIHMSDPKLVSDGSGQKLESIMTMYVKEKLEW
jgi:hypothetical protein